MSGNTNASNNTTGNPSGKTPIAIADFVLSLAYAHAKEVFPLECCGWMTGPKSRSLATALRPCDNAHGQSTSGPLSASDRTQETAYVIAGADLKELADSHDTSNYPPKVIYHSHPNGRAYFSATDQQAAAPLGGPSFNVSHLVIGVTEREVVEAALFDWSETEQKYVEVARFPGEENKK